LDLESRRVKEVVSQFPKLNFWWRSRFANEACVPLSERAGEEVFFAVTTGLLCLMAISIWIWPTRGNAFVIHTIVDRTLIEVNEQLLSGAPEIVSNWYAHADTPLCNMGGAKYVVIGYITCKIGESFLSGQVIEKRTVYF
jgi:hypothetical protein